MTAYQYLCLANGETNHEMYNRKKVLFLPVDHLD